MEQEEQLEELAKRQYSGNCPQQQFAPLSSKLRAAHPRLADYFAANYRAYRDRVVLPFAKFLRSCDELLVLVDAAMLLEGGEGMLNANLKLLEQIFKYVDPGLLTLGKPLRYVGYRRIGRIAFVATKADRVHQDDRLKLDRLLRELAAPQIRGIKAEKNLEVEYLVCAAVNSTRCAVDGEKRSMQFKVWDWTDGRAELKTEKLDDLPHVPQSWPDQWDPGAFEFPQPAPAIPRNRNNPPDHIGLHRIAEFVLS